MVESGTVVVVVVSTAGVASVVVVVGSHVVAVVEHVLDVVLGGWQLVVVVGKDSEARACTLTVSCFVKPAWAPPTISRQNSSAPATTEATIRLSERRGMDVDDEARRRTLQGALISAIIRELKPAFPSPGSPSSHCVRGRIRLAGQHPVAPGRTRERSAGDHRCPGPPSSDEEHPPEPHCLSARK